MANEKFLTAPVKSDKMPSGIPYIISNEAAERFSFYGMKTILMVFMTTYLLNSSGNPDPMSDSEASVWYHVFTFAVYLTPLAGAIIADVFLGKYLTIIVLSIVYCFGHLVLALDETRNGLALGLGLIAVGAGGIKPCVSAHVGDQFGKSNSHLLEKVFGWFYFSINLGAAASTIATPWLLEAYGPQVAFGVPGALMLLATWVFWLGRREFIHIPPKGKAFLKEVFSPLGIQVMTKLCLLYAFILMFWALFDQTGSSWVLQAKEMDRHFLGVEWLPSQIQVMNPILIMIYIPIFAFWVYPAVDKVVKVSPLRKIGFGFFLTALSFLLSAWIQSEIDSGARPNIVWQLLAYAILTAGEVMVSVTALEFSYTQAPKVMKSWIMGLFMASVALGNAFTAFVNYIIIEDPPSFVTDKAGEYVLQVRVGDGNSHHNALVTYTAVEELSPKEESTEKPSEQAEAAAKEIEEIQPLLAVPLGKTVYLDGSSAKITYYEGKEKLKREIVGKNPTWSLHTPAAGSSLTNTDITHRKSMTAKFKPDVEGDYELRLEVKKGSHAQTYKALVNITNENIPPVANAGEDREVLIGKTIKLNATESTDPNRDDLTYTWTVKSAPEGSNVNTASIARADLAGATPKLDGSSYFLFFSGCMLAWMVLYIPVAIWFKEETYIQDEDDQASA